MTRRSNRSLVGLIPAFCWMTGCVAATEGTDPEAGDGDAPSVEMGDGDGDGDGDTVLPGDGDGDGTQVGDGDGDVTTGDGDGDGTTVTTPLPLAVDGVYVPSGFMGDAAGITITPSDAEPDGTCGGARAPGDPVGDCHVVNYQNDAASMNWGGVFWQYPDGNWGEAPGLVIASGAQKVTFQARGEAGGEVVDFLVGMEGTDSFDETLTLTLTTDWVEYEIDLSGAVYDEVFGAFGWAANGDDNGETANLTFYIDDIEWQ